ncbi:uncharacterized protein RJT21DRAFT_118725 [Scheffersomyces amazonensis]|uniref:uncharacterized protein n=1 Tax=Scheffersomyces amazonensis TaxID=1078765 RepID=UPI00315D52D8
MRLRLKTKRGVKTISPHESQPFGDFIADINNITELRESDLSRVVAIKHGFPPVNINIDSVEDETIASKGIRDGDQLIVEYDEVPSSDLSNAPPSKSNKDDIPSVYIPQLNKYLILRNIPDDNSCLFNSLSSALNGHNAFQTVSPPSDLRSIVVSYIRKDPELYNELVLGREPNAYCDWITKKDSWGGAIELGILADWFNIRIDCLDIESGHFIQFKNEDKDHPPQRFVILIYSGIHYDLFVLNDKLSKSDSDKDHDESIWEIGSPEESIILDSSLKLCKLLQENDYSTNTTTFRVRCLECYKVLVGEMGASRHAEESGHFKFGEVKE